MYNDYLSLISQLEAIAYKFIIENRQKKYDEYFNEVLQKFNEVFRIALQESFVFCSVSYVEKSANSFRIWPLEYMGNNGETVTNNTYIQNILRFIKSIPEVSLTRALVTQDGDEDILFYKSNNAIDKFTKSLYYIDISPFSGDKSNDLINIEKLTLENQLNFFKKSTPRHEDIAHLFYLYKKLSDDFCPNSDAFFYFIKPVTKKFEIEFGVIATLAVSKPLSQQELALVNLILGKVLYEPQLLISEQNRSKQAIIKSVYGLGHFLKNRVLGPRNRLREFLNNIKQQNTEGIEKSEFYQLGEMALYALDKSTHIGYLLDIMGRSLKFDLIENESIFSTTEKSEWVSGNDLDLIETINRVIEDSNNTSDRKIVLEDNLSTSLIIRPYIENNKVNVGQTIWVRPADFFYEEIIVEIINNIKSYGKTNDKGDIPCILSYDETADTPCYYFLNFMTTDNYEKFPKELENKWNEFKEGTGINIYSQILNISKQGKLYFRFGLYKNNPIYLLGFNLMGIK